jgi:hypothetical protein
VVKNAQEAEREVVRIAAGVGGVEIRRQSGDDGAITIHLVVPEPRYAEFSSALATVGHWQRDEEPADLPARVTVTVRITR